MGNALRVRLTFFAVLAALGAQGVEAQDTSYHLVEGWAELPSGVEAWGQTIGVDMDHDGNLWIFHRCWAQVCTGRDDVAPVLRYDLSGRLVDSWGEGMFVWPHGFHIDGDGNIWTTDARGADGKGHTVMKLSPDGDVLLTLGTPGVAGAGEDTFDGPADVLVAPDGTIFVADGHGNDRIVKFSPDGEYLMEWGEEGTDYGLFNEPHSLEMDSRGRLFVGDRINQRIQVFDQNGRFLASWPAIMASGMAHHRRRHRVRGRLSAPAGHRHRTGERLPGDRLHRRRLGRGRHRGRRPQRVRGRGHLPKPQEIREESSAMRLITRREMLLSLPALVAARRLLVAQEAPLAAAGLHSVTLAVSDVERSLQFYQELFGLSVQARHRDKILLRIGDGPRYMALMEAGDGGPRIDHWGIALEDYNGAQHHGEARVARARALAPGSGSGGRSADGPTHGPRRNPRGVHGRSGRTRHSAFRAVVLWAAPASTETPARSSRTPPSRGDLHLTGLSHLTINVTDPATSNAFYQRVFGFDIQAYQAASPILGVGPGSDFLMFIGAGNGGARVNHVCFYMDGFDVDGVLGVLEGHGISSREENGAGPMRHWISMRMPNRGGAPGGTPELYFSDPDGLSIQLQDNSYCGGGGYLGDEC